MKNLHFKKYLTLRELKLYMVDNAKGFDTEMRKRLLKEKWPIQNKLLTVSKLLNHRNWWRSFGYNGRLLNLVAGEL